MIDTITDSLGFFLLSIVSIVIFYKHELIIRENQELREKVKDADRKLDMLTAEIIMLRVKNKKEETSSF